ncbi:MAG: ABC-type lipoprotein release transport system permease subunit [Candidatus Paceibacteria bacterium]|jgi:ABC-type lipoprotein release transport system permease subunit
MRSLRIGFLLGFRQIQRANIWTTILIIFVMMLTFLNLIAVSGILVGLIAGSERAVQDQSIGDLIITPLDDEEKILQTETIRRTLDTIPEISSYSIRYEQGVQIAANYETRRNFGIEPNVVGARALGINPIAEDAVAKLSQNVIEGDYLNPEESGYILIGALNLDRYTAGFADITGSLKDVYPGDSVRVTIGAATREFTIKGIVNAKGGDIGSSVYIPEKELRRLSNSSSRDADSIIMRLADKTPATGIAVKAILVDQGLDEFALIRTFQEALPKFITDIKQTFNILGTFIGAVGIIVASITIFIIIFINAISRRQQIGILKGIGIDRRAIEIAYVLQSAFYAIVGSAIGILVTYGFLVGYFDANPIDFPFSDGILVAEPIGTLYRFIILFIITLFAGFVPAWIIVRQNTLNSILGRK